MKTCMRYLAVVFAVVMIVCSLSAVSAAFPDVASDNAHSNAISTMTNLGIIGGYEDGTFRPDNLVRRDEMAKIVFVTYTTYTDAEEGTLIFPDVPKNSWAKGYISWCAGKNIVGGYEDGTFKPEGNITYDEALKMVCAMLGYTDFKSDLWPVDVRTKGLIDLKLGEGLEGIAGDAALTRAQIVRLVYNSLDKPIYQEIEAAEGPLSNIGAVTLAPVTNLKETVWGVTEISAQVIGTENYGFIDLDKNIKGTKTGEEDTILVRFTYDDETTEDKLINLSDVGLDSYIGFSDDLLILYIDIIAQGDKYVSCQLKGSVLKDITGGYADKTGLSESETISNGEYAKYGIKLEGTNYYNERFWNLRRLTYYDDFVLATNPHNDGAGNTINEFRILYSWQAGHNRWNEGTFSFTQGFNKIQQGMDADADGWIDYFLIEWKELFRVKKITSKTIEFEYLHANQNSSWRPVPAYKDKATGTVLYEAMDLVFPKENVAMMSALAEGDIIQGYQLGDTFTVTAEPMIETGYCVKYDATNLKYTLDNGSTLGGDYTSWKVWDSHSYGPTMFTNFNKSMDPLIGIGVSGNYNYGKYWTIDGKIIWAEAVSADSVGDAGDGYKKALLLYVTEPTEPQINEATKEHEIFYPAYLMINGRTILVNLNPTYAINKFSAETVAQEGSPYRASIVDDNGVNRVMYVNKLVTYSIDSNGYYTLYTENATMTDEAGQVIEKVLPADENNVITIDQSTGIITIKNNGITVQSKIILGADSTMYYPYTKDTTGIHEYIDYYRGSEIPKDFEETDVRSDIYLTYDEETGLYELGTLVLGSQLGGSSTVKADWRKDAREHLYAILDTEAVAEDGEIYASYSFINLSTFDPLYGINKSLEYAAALKAEKNKIYAWDTAAKDYVEVTTSNCEALKADEVISDIFVDNKVVFTSSFGEGVKIDDTVKLVAVTDTETATLKAITFEELVDVYETIAQYNEDNADVTGFTPAVLTAKIGTYTSDKLTKVAYILIDWVEYDAEENKLIIADEIDE